MELTGPQIISLLKSRLSSQSEYALAADKSESIGHTRWTTVQAPSFIATVKPATVEDIQTTVKCATEHNIPFHAVATGHNFSSCYERAQNLLEVDISNLKGVSIDASASTITVGGAVLFNEIFDPLHEAGKEMPTGACSTVGIVGVTLGGGLNRMQGTYGLLLDSLLEVELVTATGDFVKASKTENTELFWGMRGAGFNFGIVMKATYQIYDQQNGGNVMSADFVLPHNNGPEIIRILQEIHEDQPPELSVAVGQFYDEKAGGPIMLVNYIYTGDLDEGKRLIQPIIDLGPTLQQIDYLPWNQINTKWGFGADATVSIRNMPRTMFSAHVKQLDLPTFEWYFAELARYWEEYPALRGSVAIIEAWGSQKMAEIPDDETAYPHRDVKCQMIIGHQTTDPQLQPMVNKWKNEVRERFRATSGFEETKVYVNYAQGDDSQEAMYGARKLERLRALKRKWDPNCVFSWYNPIII
ncbi:putative FAD-dependent oxidase [Eremomyces bilateralis CBS 781.70]|uniref:FAD-dependent oxidase n=1 Tax=Eremomyces bilateralis CBS 781.70 TaxID=1392243 RepID=A0A6G1GCI1_9PEZI|nr:putative FAD-dependent oxidase [Eremomyces bilateralis CBS 781.70]KAF1815559.1 putative FAD-dependent oxidase [Eremomyces bilateralis CBS 781.70]